MNDAGELVAKDEATRLWITEYTADGKWLFETIGTLEERVAT